MFEAYRIGIRLTLLDGATRGLMGMSGMFLKLHGEADQLNRKMKELHSLSMRIAMSGAVAGAGGFGLGLIGRALKPGEDYTHQLVKMNMMGMDHLQIAQATAAAWRTTGQVIASNVNDNLRTFIDLRNVLGKGSHAVAALPVIARIQAVMSASTDRNIAGNSGTFGYNIAKAADIAGYAKNPAQFEHFANQMARVIIATQGRVTPMAYLQALKYARQSRYSLSDDFLFHYLPTLIQENAGTSGGGGGSRGVGPMLAAMFRLTNQGYINKKSLPELAALGLVNPMSALNTTTMGTTVAAMKGYQLAAANPLLWIQQYVMPAIHKLYGPHPSRQQLSYIMGQLFRGNQMATAAFTEFAVKPFNFERDKRIIQHTLPIIAAYREALLHDPNLNRQALAAQWGNFKTALSNGVVPTLVHGLVIANKDLSVLSLWLSRNQAAAKGLTYGLTGLFGAMAVGGTVRATTFAFKGLTMMMGAAGLTGAIGTLGAAISPILRLAAAGGTGYAIGSWLNGEINKGVGHLTHGHEHTLGGWLYDKTHPVHQHFTVQIDGEDVRHRVLRDSPLIHNHGTGGLNPLKQPLSPSLNHAPGL